MKQKRAGRLRVPPGFVNEVVTPANRDHTLIRGVGRSRRLALASAALFCESLPLLGYAGLFFLAAHAFVVWYEEPTLRRTFGQEYEVYCRQVGRWWPRA